MNDEAERVDCSMCIHYTLVRCKVADRHFPNEGHLCARFDLDPVIEDGEYDEPAHLHRPV